MLRNANRFAPGALVLGLVAGLASCARPGGPPAGGGDSNAASSSTADPSTAKSPAEGSNAAMAKPDATAPPAIPDRGDGEAHEPASDAVAETVRPQQASPPKLPPPEGAVQLHPDWDAWLDPAQRAVIVDGYISLREGMLEMFACLRGTKEHESIIAANTRADIVHAALVALGADPGKPVEWRPVYKPPSGPVIEIVVRWIDADGKQQSATAQELIKDIRTQKEMAYPFVFAGSLFWKDPEDGRSYYMAENGDFICVSNFGTAMLDIPVESSASNEALGFIAYTERIPPLGTPVRMILKPKLETAGDSDESKREKSAE